MVRSILCAVLLSAAGAAGQSTCTAYADTNAATGHDISHDPATKGDECASICASTPGCCVAEFDSHINRCYLKTADAGALHPVHKGSGIFGINCTGPCGDTPSPAPPPPSGPAVPVSVVVDATAAATPFPPYWKRSFGSGHAALTLRDDWREHLRMAVQQLGLQGVRYHGIFDDDMGPVVRAPGEYNFSLVLDTWEYQVSLGLVPIVELSFMPAILANCTWTDPHGGKEPVNPGHKSCPGTMAYRGVALPPASFDDWYQLVRALVQTATARFGAAEVRKWSFECWNELWGVPFPDPYMELYNASAAAVKSVDPLYRVGGPATAQLNGDLGGVPAFVNETQQRGLPFDFVSTHFYPSSGVRTAFHPCAGGDNWDPGCFASQMTQTRAAVPADKPLYLTEYNAGCCLSYAGHDTSESAAFAFRSVGELAGVLDVMSWWTFSDIFEEGGFPKTEFSAVYGAMTVHGVPKPAWRAFALLHEHAGTLRLPVSVSSDPKASTDLVSAFATVPRDGAPPAVFLSFWQNGGPASYSLNRTATVSVKRPSQRTSTGTWSVTEYRIDEDNGNPLGAWKAMGAPAQPSAEQLTQLMTAAEAGNRTAKVTPEGTVSVELPPNSAVVLVFADSDEDTSLIRH